MEIKSEICEPEFVAVKMECYEDYTENETDCLNNDSPQSVNESIIYENNVIDSLAIDEPQNEVHEKSLLQCDQCNKLFDKKYNLRRHVTQVHESKKVDVKVITENNMINVIIIKEPQHKFDERRVVQCDQCNKLFKNKSCLKRHVNEVHRNEKLVRSLIPKDNLINSITSNETQYKIRRKNLLQCNQCNKLFDRNYNFRRHVAKVHKRKKQDERIITEDNEMDSTTIDEPQDEFDEKCVLQCDQCNKLFNRIYNLKRHITEVHKSKEANESTIQQEVAKDTLQCKQCNKIYQSSRGLRRHVTEAHKSKEANESTITEDNGIESTKINEPQNKVVAKDTLQCKQCNKIYQSSRGLRRHVTEAHKSKEENESTITEDNGIESTKINEPQNKVVAKDTLQCKQCNKIYQSSRGLRRHVTEAHKSKEENESIITEKPDENMKTKDDAINFMKSQEVPTKEDEKNVFQCDQCNKLFKSNYRLKRHITRVHESKKVECEVCHEFFAKKSNLSVHYDLVHPGHMTHPCNECSKTFEKRKNFLRHFRSVHRNTIFECAICQKTFTNKTYLRLHITGTHEQVKGVECDICNKTFRHKTYLRIHIDAVHKRLRNFECPICHKVYGFEGYLKKHIKAIHGTIPKNHQCDICKKSFSHKSNLTKHVDRSHKNIRAYECEICHATFKQKAHKLVHIDTVHKQNKNFSCEYCGKQFGRKDNMLMHVKIVHLKLKKHECKVCKKAFRDKHYLTKHMHTVHKDIAKDTTIDFSDS